MRFVRRRRGRAEDGGREEAAAVGTEGEVWSHGGESAERGERRRGFDRNGRLGFDLEEIMDGSRLVRVQVSFTNGIR